MFKKPSRSKALTGAVCGIRFRSRKLLDSALTHPSYRHEHERLWDLENFDRLEFLGDAVLNLVICKKLYKLFPEAHEGILSRMRSTLVSRKILSRIARHLLLAKKIRIGTSAWNHQALARDKILADSFEALIAGLYLDQGFAATEKFLLKQFLPYMDAKRLLRLDPNPKSALQEICQKNWQKLPRYLFTAGPEGVSVEVQAHEDWKATAVAKTRKMAEEKAARTLVRLLRQELGAGAGAGSAKASSGRKLRKG
ncbi:MAG TPA: ribonuclease III [Verrucomicrobiae bacterium]|jgi:ribonuclease-3|nr:ribonuclease III [Verrucomicrobiae bacterium]